MNTKLRIAGEIIEFAPTSETPILVLSTKQYESWIDGIVDNKTNARITLGVAKMRRGAFGDWKSVGDGVVELRLDFGPGYRIYYARLGNILVVLLGGGNKGAEQRDIANAKKLWEELKDEIEQL